MPLAFQNLLDKNNNNYLENNQKRIAFSASVEI